MLPGILRPRRRGAAPGERAGAVPDAGAGAPAPRRWVLHPFLIAAFPVLSLFAHNLYEVPPRAVVAPLVLALAGALAVWLALRWLARDAERAGLATAVLAALFFTFDRSTRTVNNALSDLSSFWVPRSYHVHPLAMLALLALVAAPALYAIFRRLKDPGAWTAGLNTFALILVALPAAAAVLSKMREPAAPVVRASGGVPTAAHPARLPDIYYIILDGYARSDVMKDLFGFDNEPFLRRLEQKGFFVARRSTANYCQTRLSLASSLNCDYLDRLIDPSARDATPLAGLIADNLVVRSLRPHGYKFVAFSSGYDSTDIPGADVYLYRHRPTAGFHRMVIGMTPLWFLMPQVEFKDFYTHSRERTLFILDRLPEVAEREGPTFTFAHIVCPHPPFVFGENGEDVSPRRRHFRMADGSRYSSHYGGPETYRDGYRKQATFLTRRVEEMIDRLLARSPEPPIIILQSDHGSGLRHHLDDLEKTDLHERMSILNCYYFPGRRYESLTDRITPVNSFRVVLDQFLGAQLPLLEERNFFSTYSDPLVFTEVTERLRLDQDRGKQYSPPSFFPGLLH